MLFLIFSGCAVGQEFVALTTPSGVYSMDVDSFVLLAVAALVIAGAFGASRSKS